MPAQVVAVDCLSSRLHLGFDPQSWIKKKQKAKKRNPKHGEEPDPMVAGGTRGCAHRCPVPQITLTLFAGHGATLCTLSSLGILRAAPCLPASL